VIYLYSNLIHTSSPPHHTGANPSIRDGEGNTVLHLASSIGDEGLASLFAPNADFAYCVNNDGQTALDIAVEKGFSSFAEHLNNLLYESYENGQHENDGDPEEVDTNVTDQEDEQYVSSADEDVGPPPDQEVENADNVSVEHDAIPNMTDHDSSPTHVDDDEHDEFYDSNSNFFPNDIDGNDETLSDEALLNQLNHMTNFAQTQTQELYQTKYALNKLVQENEALKNELAHCSTSAAADTTTTTDNSSSADDLTNKSLAELNNLEMQAKQTLDRIIKAKEVASTQLEDEMEQLRTCVICKEHTKSVLLMPCRHLCCCTECGHLDLLIQCPLCREPITERINVFS